ncbi:hypothetical protein EHQ76_07205 [Leptospira barantonii]|uniref:Uncharacterized protein n=1 Tax=Leptospira barantonii TaxID=2023184 RepID=A0A5F2BHF5_9LEPT|nr:hypothetical protein EHQ76_07205 [Leptospira barantonii]
MDPLKYLKIYPIGDGWPEYWVEDSRSGAVVFKHPERAWCVAWVIEEHIRTFRQGFEQKAV